MRRGPAAALALCMALLPITIASSQTRPPAPPADQLAAPGHPGWSVDTRSGCWVWNSNPRANATATWSGACNPGGPATGRGVLEWRYEESGERKVARYEGEYRDGKPHGRGVYAYASGNRYEGDYRDGKLHGRGVYTFANGNRYEGELRDDKYDGRGVLTFASGNRYEGDFRDGKFNGRGVFMLASGARYEGEFRDGRSNGRGVLTFANGNRYEGDFRDDKFNGRAGFTWTA